MRLCIYFSEENDAILNQPVKYWPDSEKETLIFDHMKVTLLASQDIKGEIQQHDLLIEDSISKKCLNVTHYYFAGWPEHGIPNDAYFIFEIIFAIRHLEPKCFMAHCATGSGQSGTFLALYNLIEQIESNQQFLDVFQEVLKLRQCRKFMVRDIFLI